MNVDLSQAKAGSTRLLMVTPYPPTIDGIGAHAASLLEALPPEIERRVLTKVSPDGPSVREEGGIRVCRASALSPNGLRRCLREAKEFTPDIVHVQFAGSLLSGAFVVAMAAGVASKYRRGSSLVVTDHEVSRDIERFGILGRALHRGVDALADTVVVYSKESERALVEKCGIPSARIELMPHGVTTRTGNYLEEDLEQPFVLLCGFIHPDKGIEFLLGALSGLRDAGVALPRVLIAGSVRARNGIFAVFGRQDRRYELRLHELVDKLALSEVVTFVGYVPDEQLKDMLGTATVVVLPYLRSNQSGILNLAVGAGAAILASDLPGLRDALGDGARWAPPGDSGALAVQLGDLLKSPGKRLDLRRKARQAGKEQSMEIVGHTLAGIYQQLIAKRRLRDRERVQNSREVDFAERGWARRVRAATMRLLHLLRKAE